MSSRTTSSFLPCNLWSEANAPSIVGVTWHLHILDLSAEKPGAASNFVIDEATPGEGVMLNGECAEADLVYSDCAGDSELESSAVEVRANLVQLRGNDG